jgi:hypothetical protein
VGRHAGEEGSGAQALETGAGQRGCGKQGGEAEAGEIEGVAGDVLNRAEEVFDQAGKGFGDRFEQAAVLAAVFGDGIQVGDGVRDGMLEQDGGPVVERMGAWGGWFDPGQVELKNGLALPMG